MGQLLLYVFSREVAMKVILLPTVKARTFMAFLADFIHKLQVVSVISHNMVLTSIYFKNDKPQKI
jgi:hypothetical protein